MSRQFFAAVRVVLPLAIVGFAVPAAAEVRPVDSSELARCAAISDGNERLACYDALAVVAVPGIRIAPATVAAPAGGTPAPATRAASAGGTPAPATGAASGGGAAAPVAGTAAAAGGSGATAAAPVTHPDAGGPAAASQAVPAARSTNLDDPANFGLTRQQLQPVPAGPASIKATVSQITEDRLSHVYLVLDNGQTWAFTEADPRVRPGDTVTIKRASLGSFLMLTPSRRSYRVERLH
jgi:hypothetical protein